ncbi:hypothetical protein AB1Y20_003848 [Prymnesium parvum]|uniref:Uncharacterized protein n=1 Tax=Prymnesium parvum TaxID=97485 RepID=A0AB34J5T9_PRYPA
MPRKECSISGCKCKLGLTEVDPSAEIFCAAILSATDVQHGWSFRPATTGRKGHTYRHQPSPAWSAERTMQPLVRPFASYICRRDVDGVETIITIDHERVRRPVRVQSDGRLIQHGR